MKTLPLLAALSLAPLAAIAAPPPPLDPGAGAASPKPGDRLENSLGRNLDPATKQRLKAAIAEAMKEPGVQAARERTEAAAREFQEALRAAIAKQDPALAAKLPPPRQKFAGPPRKNSISALEPDERRKLIEARQAARNDPAVKAAHDKIRAATTPDERRAAQEEYRKAMAEALGKRDPSLRQQLEQFGKPPSNAPSNAPAAPSSGVL